MKQKEKSKAAPNTLNSLCIGEQALIGKIDDGCSMKKRFTDFGICPGETVKCTMKSPFGDPRAYLIRGAVIAIRKRDAAFVHIIR